MNILCLCLSPDRGGLELYAYRCMQWLEEKELLKLAVIRPSTPLHEWVRMENIDVLSLEARGIWPFKAARKLADAIDENLVDAIHINWGRDLHLAVLAKRLTKQNPVLVYSRHMRIPESKRDPYHRWIYRQVDRLIVTTREMYDQARNNLPIDRGRVHHLYLGVPRPEPAGNEEWARLLTEAGLDPERFTIGLFGRVEHEKGQHVLVDAMRCLIDSGCNVQALIIGHPMNATYYAGLKELIARNCLEDRVRLHGFMNKADRLMHCFDVVVLASYCEHFGLVLIEAMHAGVAVVGTAAGGVPEIIDHGITGLLCEPGSVNDLADKITFLYNNPAVRNKVSNKGRERAQDLFSDARHFESFTEQVRETVDQKKYR